MKPSLINEVCPQDALTLSLNRHPQLPVELFKTSEGYYVFDANYVTFLEVNQLIYKIVSILTGGEKDEQELMEELPEYSAEDIRDALEEIKEIQDQGYLKRYDFHREKPHAIDDIKKTITSSQKTLHLNITSKCNLSCSYCVFGGEYGNHPSLNQQEMSWETAQAAIEFFLSQAVTDGPLRVDFFGGEPLTAFPLMERVVSTLKERGRERNQEVSYSVSSNGTILNDKIIDFLIKNDFHFQVSIDGEKEVQDANRKFRANQRGSFDTIIKNLQLIFDRDPEYYKNRVRLKAVISTKSLQTDSTDFFNIPLVKVLNDRKQFSMLNQEPDYASGEDEDFFARLDMLSEELLQKRGAKTVDELLDGIGIKKRYLFYLTFYNFFNAQIINNLYFSEEKPIPYLKDCMIGYEGCVNVDGSISICYKATSFVIGNVYEKAWYWDKIEEYQDKRYGLPGCKDCFMRRLCKLCFDKISGEQDQLNRSIANYCQFSRKYYRVIFQVMLTIMENNPGLWDELQKLADKERDILKKQKEEAGK